MDKLAAILLAINILTFLVFAADKRRAVKGRFRIREAVLLALCLAGGSAGGLIAMYGLHHKTRKAKFSVGVPVILAVQIAVIAVAVIKF